MKRYIVTEKELLQAFGASHGHGMHKDNPEMAERLKREAYEKQRACKAREVPDEATHFVCIISGMQMFPPQEIPQ